MKIVLKEKIYMQYQTISSEKKIRLSITTECGAALAEDCQY